MNGRGVVVDLTPMKITSILLASASLLVVSCANKVVNEEAAEPVTAKLSTVPKPIPNTVNENSVVNINPVPTEQQKRDELKLKLKYYSKLKASISDLDDNVSAADVIARAALSSCKKEYFDWQLKRSEHLMVLHGATESVARRSIQRHMFGRSNLANVEVWVLTSRKKNKSNIIF